MKMMRRSLFMAAIVAAAFAAESAGAFELTSPDFKDGAAIPEAQIYTRCGGDNVAPELNWTSAPAGAKSFVLTVTDTSVLPSQWSHWIVVNIPASAAGLPKGGALPAGAAGVESNFGDKTYAGPCPPAGTGVHTYEFAIYALPGPAPAIAENGNAKDLGEALRKLALASATLHGSAVTP